MSSGRKKEPGALPPGLAGIPEWDTGILSGGLHRGASEESSSPLLGGLCRHDLGWRDAPPPTATGVLSRLPWRPHPSNPTPLSSSARAAQAGRRGVVERVQRRGSSGIRGTAIILRGMPSFRRLPVPQLPLFFAGQAGSLIGMWLQLTAMSWLMYRLTQAATWVGCPHLRVAGPRPRAGPIAGALADRSIGAAS